MLFRISSLFVYVVSGLVISAAATPAVGSTVDYSEARPMVQSSPKSPAHPKPYYPMDKAYARRDDAPYPRPHRDEKKLLEKPHPEEKKEKAKEHRPDNSKDRMSVDEKDRDRKDYEKGRKDNDRYHKDDDKYRKDDDKYRKDDDKYRKDDDKNRKDDDGDRKDYNGDRKDYDGDRKDYDKGRKDYDKGRKVDHDKGRKDSNSYPPANYNPANAYCTVGEQHCCDSVNTVEEAKELGLLSVLSWASVFDASALVGKNCAPFLFAAGGGKCQSAPICCDKSNFEGVIAVGCSNVNII